jgi:hypothetical protein
MLSPKFTISAGLAAGLLATSASASVTTYIRCDRFNVSCLHVHCNDETRRCTWVNGYNDRYGDFMRAEYAGYFHSYGRWLCVRGPGCSGPDEPVAAPPLTAPAPPSP